MSLSQVFAASRTLKADPALSDASSLTTFGGMMRRYGSPTKIKEQAMSQLPSSGQSIVGGSILEKKFGALEEPPSAHTQMNTLQAQERTPDAAEQSGLAPRPAPGLDFDPRHHDDAASLHDARPRRSNYINNTSPDLESSTPAAITKTEKKVKDDPATTTTTTIKPIDEARHISSQSEHRLTNGSADPRL